MKERAQQRIRADQTRPALATRKDAAAVLGLLALTLGFFWKIALTNRVLAGVDVFAYFYPYRDAVSAALRAGHLPLWNPYLFMGAPLLANSQAAALYPLHWPFLGMAAPQQVAWSIVLHVALAGVGTYLFARLALRLRRPGACAAALLFSLAGFLGAQVEHLNQLNASVWLPWLLLCVDAAGRPRPAAAVLGGGAVVGLTLLAGHTQAAYIVLAAAGVYALLRAWQSPVRPRWRALFRALALLVTMVLMGVLLAAAQLLPTWELSRLSIRSGGLPYREAASFSLKPPLLFKAFLPPLLWQPPFSEYVAYVGLTGLALAGLGTWAVVRVPRPEPDSLPPALRAGGWTMLLLALLGIFLAFGAYNPVYYLLYRLVPGFALFRVPARWLLLYAFGAAALAGIGLQVLPTILRPVMLSAAKHLPGAQAGPLAGALGDRRGRRLAGTLGTVALLLLLVAELLLASRRLAYNQPTAPAAFDSLRTAPAHLLADAGSEPFRFLSLSDMQYDPGDQGDLQAMYEAQLPEAAVYDLIVASKMKEVLAYNLPLRYRLSSVDGYDGGLLPIANYVTLERLFLPEDQIWPDGRLRQQLRRVPPARLLSLLNVKYIITDKTQDVWIDDVFYDLEHTVPLGRVSLGDLPEFPTTQVGVVSYLTDTAALEDGTPVAVVTVTDTTGITVATTLRAGQHTAEGRYSARPVRHRQARIGHPWRDEPQGSDYVAVLDLLQEFHPGEISVRSLLPGQRVHLRGLTLIHGPTGTSRALSIVPAYRLVHSGDVKIYENRAVLPRAFVVPRACVVPDDGTALDLLRDPAFDPSREVILADGSPQCAHGGLVAGSTSAENEPAPVQILGYEPERIDLQVDLSAPGTLVLTDAYYPGWSAEVDGQPAPIRRADLYFRAVALDTGSHRVTFRYEPRSAFLGIAVSLAAWVAWLVAATIAVVACIGRKGTTIV